MKLSNKGTQKCIKLIDKILSGYELDDNEIMLLTIALSNINWNLLKDKPNLKYKLKKVCIYLDNQRIK